MEDRELLLYIKEQQKTEDTKWAQELINNLNLDY